MVLFRHLKHWLLAACLSLVGLGCAAQSASDCKPAPENVAELVQIRPRFHTVKGPLAEFDPCHKASRLSVPTRWNGSPLPSKPPLVIIAHGGGGLGMLENNLATALRKHDIATLVFDAYQLNGFYQGYPFWGSQATNESRQRMIYKAAKGAYEWALTQSDKVDTRAIFLQGVSNGAAVVANLASVLESHGLNVIDRGPGIPAPVAAQIFTPFYTTSEHGTGLGLYIAQQLCEANQCSLSYQPVPGGGSCFRIVMPPGMTLMQHDANPGRLNLA